MVGAKPRVNEALPPGSSDEGQLVNGPSVYGDCENTLETIAGVGRGSLLAAAFVTVKVAVFFPPTLTCPNERVLPDEMGAVVLSKVTLVVNVGATALPVKVAMVAVDTFSGGLEGHPVKAGYAR